MNKLKTILVGADFSDCSRSALEQAVRLAKWNHARLHALRVASQDQTEWNNWTSQAKLSALAGFEKNCRALLENNLRQFTAVPPETPALCSVTQAKTHGHGIAEYCRSLYADLVVLGNRGRTTLKHILLGSTIERLLKEIPCSVLVVRSPATATESAPAISHGQ